MEKTGTSRIGKPKGATKQALPNLGREQASSQDGMMLAGGLALFVLVLADTVLLTLSTRVLRVR